MPLGLTYLQQYESHPSIVFFLVAVVENQVNNWCFYIFDTFEVDNLHILWIERNGSNFTLAPTTPTLNEFS